MFGAITGDILGSVYEGAGLKTKDFRLYVDLDRPTDDSVMSLAVARAIVAREDMPSFEDFAMHLREVGRRYPYAGYGGSFRRWLQNPTMGPYHSWGNGSAMRAGAVGWAYDDTDQVLEVASRSAMPTHDHPEGVKGAQAVALAVLLARRGASREEIRRELAGRFSYDMNRRVDSIRPGYHFEVSCQKSVPEAIIAFLDSTDFEDAIRSAVSLGGDADTQACIAGAVAEAFYGGVPETMTAWVLPRLDGYLVEILRAFASRYMAGLGLTEAIDRYVPDLVEGGPGAPSPTGDARGGRRGAGAHRYQILLHQESRARLEDYAARLASAGGAGDDGGQGNAGPKSGDGQESDTAPGARLGAVLESWHAESRRGSRDRPLDGTQLLQALLKTKKPRIFAESEVAGDGSDWSAEELGLLGDIGVAVPVTVFDNGRHSAPEIHEKPFPATLLFVAGALLRSGGAGAPADAQVLHGTDIDADAYLALYERRLFPALNYASVTAAAAGRRALVTIPGLGCGQFAGRFRGRLGAYLQEAIRALLVRHAAELPGLATVWFDPYDECEPSREDIGGIGFLVRPLTKSPPERPQLSQPSAFEEAGDDYSDCELYSVVAWDHVSWPGNDFYAGARATDDGVKAAATDTMFAMTGFRGFYDPGANAYLPPSDAGTWESVVRNHRLRIRAEGNVMVVQPEANQS